MAFLQLRTVNNAAKESNCHSWIGEDVVVAYCFNALLRNFPAVTGNALKATGYLKSVV
jgi:hypothetical protein